MADLCTVADVKQYLGLDAQAVMSQDPLLAVFVSAASRWIQGAVGRSLALGTFTDYFDGDGTTSLRIGVAQLNSVASVVVDGNTIQPRSDTSDGWFQRNDWLYLSGPTGSSGTLPWGPYGPYMSPTRMSTMRFPVGTGNVAVTYSAGYSLTGDPKVPDDLRYGVTLLAAEEYQRRNRLGVMSKGIAGEAVTFQTLTMHPVIQTILGTYSTPRP